MKTKRRTASRKSGNAKAKVQRLGDHFTLGALFYAKEPKKKKGQPRRKLTDKGRAKRFAPFVKAARKAGFLVTGNGYERGNRQKGYVWSKPDDFQVVLRTKPSKTCTTVMKQAAKAAALGKKFNLKPSGVATVRKNWWSAVTKCPRRAK